MMTAVAILVCANSFAETQSSGFSKNSNQLNKLGAAIKHHSTVVPKIDNDIMMGYAGQDVSSKPSIIV